jgi:multimeric flavodoxin WrbA
MKILIINGSHRKGNTDSAVEMVKNEIDKLGHEVRILVLREMQMDMPDGCEDCAEGEICPNIKDEFSEKVEPTIRDYDIYIVATPTWDDGVTPLTKIFWDRIVSWCNKKRMYLKNKKLAIITHGMAGKESWVNVINWMKSVCVWEEAIFSGSLTFRSGSKIGEMVIDNKLLAEFVDNELATFKVV